jgi:hypothetical protein
MYALKLIAFVYVNLLLVVKLLCTNTQRCCILIQGAATICVYRIRPRWLSLSKKDLRVWSIPQGTTKMALTQQKRPACLVNSAGHDQDGSHRVEPGIGKNLNLQGTTDPVVLVKKNLSSWSIPQGTTEASGRCAFVTKCNNTCVAHKLCYSTTTATRSASGQANAN